MQTECVCCALKKDMLLRDETGVLCHFSAGHVKSLFFLDGDKSNNQ